MPLVISGVTGLNADFGNGRHEVVDRDVHRKVGDPDKWLFANHNGQWMVGATNSKHARKTVSNGYAYTMAKAGGRPPAAGAVE